MSTATTAGGPAANTDRHARTLSCWRIRSNASLATGTLAMAWTGGAPLACDRHHRTGQMAYLAPVLLHALVAVVIARAAAQRMVWD